MLRICFECTIIRKSVLNRPKKLGEQLAGASQLMFHSPGRLQTPVHVIMRRHTVPVCCLHW